MRDSDTYMAIIDEGQEEHAKKVILRLGGKRFGPPEEQTRITVQGITDLDRLERIIDRVLEASDWQDLLGTP
jgi:hypothetical protein